MRWKCICCYDGTNFHGWQSQSCGKTIQDFIERRLEWIFSQKTRIHGCSRTDSGVHAYHQVFHFDGEWIHGAKILLQAFQCGLPREIKILSVEEVDESFHARFSAKGKTYVYNILEDTADPFNYKYLWALGSHQLDINSMNQLANKLIGTHDFSAFGASNNCDKVDNPVKTIQQMEFIRDNKNILFTTTGSGYLYKMVRSLVGTSVAVGLNKISTDKVYEVFLSKIRTNIIETAPTCGLFLKEIYY